VGFLWCPFCKNPHLLSEQTCPLTGQTLQVVGKKKSVEIGSLVQNKYLLKKCLGTGAFGVVYAAENVILGGHVALKFLGKQSDEAAARFHQEARIANSLGHPNICRVFDVGSTRSGTPFFAMELLHGQTLRERMARGRLRAAEACSIFSQVLSGLGAADAQGVVHRDMKPENVFLEAREGLEPVARVLDFGLAKLVGRAAGHTGRGLVVGTVAYMAPEQVVGDPISDRCDLFAIGVMLYESLARLHPFRATNHAEMSRRILREPQEPLSRHSPQATPALESFLARALEKDPARRFSSARAMQIALHEAMGVVEWDDAPPLSEIPRLPSFDENESSQTIPNQFYKR